MIFCTAHAGNYRLKMQICAKSRLGLIKVDSNFMSHPHSSPCKQHLRVKSVGLAFK